MTPIADEHGEAHQTDVRREEFFPGWIHLARLRLKAQVVQ